MELTRMRRFLSARSIAAALCAGALLTGTQAAWAGAQKEEYLADSVRSALSAAVADSRPLRPVFASNDTIAAIVSIALHT
jgi:uncharacterized membrane protein